MRDEEVCRAVFRAKEKAPPKPGAPREEDDRANQEAASVFTQTGIDTVFENLDGFPVDWKTNAPAFIKFVRDHQCPSFLEYGEYPYVSADEIKKALRVKASVSLMLDQMQ